MIIGCTKNDFVESGIDSINSKAATVVNSPQKNTVEKDEWTDFIVFGNSDDNYSIYKMDINGDNLRKISNGKMEGIDVLREYVYYKDSEFIYEPGPLRRVSWNGEKDEEVIAYLVEQYIVTDEYIFFESDNKLYRSDKEGNNIITLAVVNRVIYDMKYSDGKLYFNTSQGIYMIKEDGKDLSIVVSGGFYKFNISQDLLIYNNNDVVVIYNLKKQEKVEVSNKNNYELFVIDDYIYYSQDQFLVRENIYTNNKDKIFLSTFSYNFFGYGEYVYCFGDNFIWRVDKDLQNKKVVFGKGNVFKTNMLLVNDDYTFVRSYDFINYKDHLTFLYDAVDPTKKLIEEPIDNAVLIENTIYYVNHYNKKLYKYNLITHETELIINDPVLEFVIIDNLIYFSRNDNYKLYVMKDGGIKKIIDNGVYNIKYSNGHIYYIDRDDNNSLYKLDAHKMPEKILDDFTTQYEIVDNTIYYRNESQKGELYRKRNNVKTKLTEVAVDGIYYNTNLYYIVSEGINILYQLEVHKEKSNIAKFIGMNYLDFIIKDNEYIEAVASESGTIAIRKARYNKDLALYEDNSLTYEKVGPNTYICMYENYIYKYHNGDNTLVLLHPYPVNRFQVKDGWIYITGDIYDNKLKSYIKRISIASNSEEYLIESNEFHTPSYNFVVDNDKIYYYFPYQEHRGNLYVKDIKSKNVSILVNDCNQIVDIVNDQIIYMNSENYIFSIDKKGQDKKILVNEKSEYLGISNSKLYYFSYADISFDGYIKELDLKEGTISNVSKEPIKTWDYYVFNNYVYYLLEDIMILNINTGETKAVYQKDIQHFYINNRELIVYIEEDNQSVIHRYSLEELIG